MFTKKRLPLLIAIICCIEILIYFWSVWTATFDKSNFFGIEPAFIFDKCARISGRVSSILLLFPLLMVGNYGLKKIYSDEKKKDSFIISITLFTLNHLIHFIFIFIRFKSQSNTISIVDNMHGFITFIFIIIIPYLIWTNKNLNKMLYSAIIIHLFNISYFINKTFWSKVRPDHLACHNQFGILVITAACLYILYRVYFENKQNYPTH